MPDGWKPLKDGEIVIAHVSDLHFGSRNVDESWGLVQQQLRVIKPELILVTGDLVDTPERGDYQRAREKLDSLGINYYVCMGNHDRFPRGNRLAFQQWLGSWWYRGCVVCAVLFVAGLLLWFLCQWWLWILTAVALLLAGLLWLLPWMLTHLWSDEAAGWFNHVFDGKVLGPDRAIEVNIGPDSVPWQLGLVGADSNSRADAWARGFIPEEQFQTLADTTQGKQWDLCIILVHHHLLPIRELEGKWQQDPLRWANLSCLVNAGRFLEALTEAQVDLVLHGHEHAANWASYGSLIQGHGTVRVVAAGSATGNRSVQGCQADQATFNVLVLGADRSVRLRCLSRKQGDWNVEELPLFDPATVRHGRMRRARTSLKRRGEINSEITKYVEFTRERDVWVYWRYTHWRLPKDEFVQKIRNSTGEPDQAEVRVYGYEPNATTFKPEVQVERHYG